MQIIGSEAGKYVFNLARGEELFSTLLSWCEAEGVQGATLTGLGAADEMEIAYYHLGTKTFERQTVTDEVEILSLQGNLAMLDGKRALHIHAVLGRRDLSTFGGHLFLLRVSGACEIHLTTFPDAFLRKPDAATGLNLLCDADGTS